MFIFNHYSLRALNESTRLHYKKHALVMAILLIICGVCCLIYPFIAGMYIALLSGMMFMICGFYTLYSLIVFRKQPCKSRLASCFFALAWLLLGYSFIASPQVGLNALAIILCCLFFIGGVARIVSGFTMRGHTGYIWSICIGIFDLIIAAVWSGMSPQQSSQFTTAFIGLEMLFSAGGYIALRISLARAQRQKMIIKKSR
ncbi:DUF308 domain-containing protein [Dryocola clanedunensis]